MEDEFADLWVGGEFQVETMQAAIARVQHACNCGVPRTAPAGVQVGSIWMGQAEWVWCAQSEDSEQVSRQGGGEIVVLVARELAIAGCG